MKYSVDQSKNVSDDVIDGDTERSLEPLTLSELDDEYNMMPYIYLTYISIIR